MKKKPARKNKTKVLPKTKHSGFRQLVLKNRSYRRFYQDVRIAPDVLNELVDLARVTASARNLQPLKYYLTNCPGQNALVFPNLRWAGYLKEGGIDIPDGERPSAYILILCDKAISLSAGCDHGIAAQTILLGAVEKGLGGCIIGSIDVNRLKEALRIPDGLDILFVIALGKPKEKVVLEDLRAKGDIKYWRDETGVHHVPKRPLKDVIIKTED